MRRVCFQLQVRPDRIDEYRRRHAEVWPEMLEALHAAGWHNYSLFLRPDGLLIGYLEPASLEADPLKDIQARMAVTDVNRRWQAEMAELFEDLDGAPDEGFLELEEIFHLEDQLAAHREAAGTSTAQTTAHETRARGESN
ncbi:L-rhamnose mutarotase [Mumia sp. DW29H23]|uniref:L-rhamnose mutarotase n=1 Tax=Mumia sp. DW29H23 TaxID=3421241 RepID=UPI003D687CB5